MKRKRKLRRINERTPSNGASKSSSIHSPHNKPDEASTRRSKRLRKKMASQMKQSTNNYRSIDTLPNDTLAKILFGGFIDLTPLQLANISCVCERFKLVADTSVVSLDLRKAKLPLLKHVINRYTNLCHLDFSDNREFGYRHMQLLLPVREKLQSLKLRGTKISDLSIMSFFGVITRDSCFRLEVLDLSRTTISQKSAVTIATCCPRLKSLRLSTCKGISDAFLECVPTQFTKLQALDVSMCPITVKGCQSLFHAQSLREVDISACPELNKHAIRALVTGLIECDEKDAPDNVEVLNETELRQRTCTRRVSQLISISAQYMKELDSSLLDDMAVSASHLRRLDLRHYHDIDNTDLSPIKISLRKLQENGVHVAFSSRQNSIGTTTLNN